MTLGCALSAYGGGGGSGLASGDTDFSVVVTNEGINDRTVEGDTPDEFETDAQNWITTVQAVGKVAVLLEPNPIAPAFVSDKFVDATAYLAAVDKLPAQ